MPDSTLLIRSERTYSGNEQSPKVSIDRELRGKVSRRWESRGYKVSIATNRRKGERGDEAWQR